VAEQELKPVYLLTGTDRPKIETAVHRLRRHFDEGSVELVSATQASGEEAVALCNAGSLFGDRRLVVVADVDGMKRDDGRRTGGWKAADLDAVAAYLSAPSPTTVLALLATELPAASPLRKICAKAGDVLDYSVPKRGLGTWVAGRFKQLGVRAEPDASAALLQLVGDDPRALQTEIDKLAIWAGEEPIGEREVEALVAATKETPTFALTDAWGARDTARVLDACEAMLERSDRTRREATARIVGALSAHLGRLRQFKRLAAEGVGSREAAGRLRMHPFYAEKVARQAEAFGDEELADAVLRLADLDLALKGKSRLAPELELQRALVDLGRRAGDDPAGRPPGLSPAATPVIEEPSRG
jgi:DNA polymerase-3 subunit delta